MIESLRAFGADYEFQGEVGDRRLSSGFEEAQSDGGWLSATLWKACPELNRRDMHDEFALEVVCKCRIQR
jgi:hypothetical protein